MRVRSLLAAAVLAFAAGLVADAAEAPKPPAQKWSFDGIFGTYDRAALQRGFQVYKDVCASCHSLNLIRYRDLSWLGFNEDEIKAIALGVQVMDGPNDNGEMFERAGRPADRLKAPYANEKAARAANNGAAPPDLSLMVEARKGGADYTFAILTGYKNPPGGMTMLEGMHYNQYFPGGQIAMAPPLAEGRVDYADKTKASIEQMARDVTTFLAWASEPNLEHRKALGIKVILFLIILSALLYVVKRRVWADLH
jgi:ubiquinol-cytochrome c reductase cytochrome c1 subunit